MRSRKSLLLALGLITGLVIIGMAWKLASPSDRGRRASDAYTAPADPGGAVAPEQREEGRGADNSFQTVVGRPDHPQGAEERGMRASSEPIRLLPGEWGEDLRESMSRSVASTRELLGEIRAAEARGDWRAAHESYHSIVVFADWTPFDMDALLRRNSIDVDAIYDGAIACEKRLNESELTQMIERRRSRRREAAQPRSER